jgi:hypothetical protein
LHRLHFHQLVPFPHGLLACLLLHLVHSCRPSHPVLAFRSRNSSFRALPDFPLVPVALLLRGRLEGPEILIIVDSMREYQPEFLPFRLVPVVQVCPSSPVFRECRVGLGPLLALVHLGLRRRPAVRGLLCHPLHLGSLQVLEHQLVLMVLYFS